MVGSMEIFSLSHPDYLWLAQQVQDPRVIDQITTAFNNFVQSGQAAAMIIGMIIGYMIRVFTGS